MQSMLVIVRYSGSLGADCIIDSSQELLVIIVDYNG